MFKFLLFFSLMCVLLSAHGQSSSDSLPELQLANLYHENIPVQDYWVSEKLDGVRAYWDGHQLISKQGHIFQSPDWFTRGFPDFPLDGELWLARSSFDKLSGVVRKRIAIDSEWQQVTFQVFDLPGSDQIFDERLKYLISFFESRIAPSWLVLVEQYKVSTHQELMNRLEQVIALGGEGLMLHLGSSFYHAKRNDELLKLKKYFDAEARVLSYVPGKGKYKGMLGSIYVEAINKDQKGRRFKLGSGFTDEQRRIPPQIGSVITYKYYGLTNKGLPRFASFLRIRSVE